MYVWKLLKKLKNFNITLSAGEKGLNRTVRWYHIAEDTSVADFIIGNEIIFTTGIELGEDTDKIIEFIDALYKHGISGIIFNCGKYINHIPPQVIDYCNEKSLPLLEIPWTEKLVNVGKAVSTALLEDERFIANMQNAVNIALLIPTRSKANKALFNEYGFTDGKFYAIAAGDISTLSKEAAGELANNVRNSLVNITSCVFITVLEKKLIVIAAHTNPNVLENEIDLILKTLNKFTLCGRSKINQGIRNLNKYYKQAEENLISNKILANCALNRDKQCEILFEIKDKAKINEYCSNIIGPLIALDNRNGSNYFKTLKCYFKNNGSVLKTSQEMNIHRNTINYKIKKIETLLGIDLSNLEERFSIMLAIKLKDIYDDQQ